PRSSIMARRKNEKPRRTAPKKDKELQAIYDRIRREFTAADLAKYAEIDEGIPLKQVLADLTRLERQLSQKRNEKAETQSKLPERSKVMPKRKNERTKPSQANKDKKLQAIYDRIRREFSAADLQKYTVIE